MKPIRLGLAVSLVALAAPGAAFSAMGACESAIRNKTPDEEIRLYTICMDELPESAMAGALHNRAVAHLEKGDLNAAEADLNASLSYDNEYGLAYFNRALIHARYGDIDLALADLSRAIELPPSRIHSAARLRRANLFQITGDYAGAVADYDRVIARQLAFLDPDRREKLQQRAEARLGKAWVLAAASDASVRDGAQAVTLAQEALDHEDSAYGRAVLAAAFAEAGRFPDAVREQQLAMQMAAQAGAPADATLEGQLAAYQADQPYRQPLANCAEESAAVCGAAWAENEGMVLRVGRISTQVAMPLVTDVQGGTAGGL